MNQPSSTVRTIALGGDHAGFPMKQILVDLLRDQEYEVIDCGPNDGAACDFPDYAELVAEQIRSSKADRGIMVCGSGVGVCVAANKIPGIRASICHDTYSARQGVEHDDMNVLCIGARIIGEELARELIGSFLSARYSPQDRHQRRVDKILDIERRANTGQFS